MDVLPRPKPRRVGSLLPREVVYRGIHMRSRLEAYCAGWLDERHLDWAYEPIVYASQRGQYLPDFVVRPACTGLDHYLELKGFLPLEANENYPRETERIARQMAIIWETEGNAVLHLHVRAPKKYDLIGVRGVWFVPGEVLHESPKDWGYFYPHLVNDLAALQRLPELVDPPLDIWRPTTVA